MTIEGFMAILVRLAAHEFPNGEWYVQHSAVDSSVSLHVAEGPYEAKITGYKWMNDFISRSIVNEATLQIEEGIKSITRRIAKPYV